MKILFTTPILEHPAGGGPQLRIENSIKALSRIAEIDIVYRVARWDASIDETEQFYREYCCEYVTLIDYPNWADESGFTKLLLRVGGVLLRGAVKRQARQIVRHAQRRGIDIFWFGFGNISFPLIKAVRQLMPSGKIVCDTDSVWSRFVLRGLPYSRGFHKLRVLLVGKLKEMEERALVDVSDVTTAVSEVDAEYYRGLTRDATKIHLFSNVIDIHSYQNSAEKFVRIRRPALYLAGSFGPRSPMNIAAEWMLRDVLPRVLRRYPSAHFYIVGRNSDREFGHLQDNNVTVTGRVPSVLPYLRHADVAVVPLKFESGTRFKLLEAGACKVPVVSTTLGAEGIPVGNERDVLIADDAETFACAIVRLLDDRELACRLAERCFQLVESCYSVEALTREAVEIIQSFRARVGQGET